MLLCIYFIQHTVHVCQTSMSNDRPPAINFHSKSRCRVNVCLVYRIKCLVSSLELYNRIMFNIAKKYR